MRILDIRRPGLRPLALALLAVLATALIAGCGSGSATSATSAAASSTTGAAATTSTTTTTVAESGGSHATSSSGGVFDARQLYAEAAPGVVTVLSIFGDPASLSGSGPRAPAS